MKNSHFDRTLRYLQKQNFKLTLDKNFSDFCFASVDSRDENEGQEIVRLVGQGGGTRRPVMNFLPVPRLSQLSQLQTLCKFLIWNTGNTQCFCSSRRERDVLKALTSKRCSKNQRYFTKTGFFSPIFAKLNSRFFFSKLKNLPNPFVGDVQKPVKNKA